VAASWAQRWADRSGARVIEDEGRRRYAWPCKVPGCDCYADPVYDVTLLCTWHAECVPATMWHSLDVSPDVSSFMIWGKLIVDYATAVDAVING
jgi:hypothetical protein